MAGQALVHFFQPVYDRGHLIEGVLAQLRHASVARDAPGDYLEDTSTPLSNAEIQICGLPQDACVQFKVLLLDYLPGCHALVRLLMDDEGEDDLAGQFRCGATVDHGREGAFHVDGCPAI